MAEESTDGEAETQAYNQDSQDSIGEVSKHIQLLKINCFDLLKHYLLFFFFFFFFCFFCEGFCV
jgi:hypothetical protein